MTIDVGDRGRQGAVGGHMDKVGKLMLKRVLMGGLIARHIVENISDWRKDDGRLHSET